MRKECLMQNKTTRAQINMCIRTVLSAHVSLVSVQYINAQIVRHQNARMCGLIYVFTVAHYRLHIPQK